MLSFVIPEDPRHPDPNEQVPPPVDPKDPLPIREPGTDIPSKDPTPTPEEQPGDEPIIDPPPLQAN